MGGAVGGFVPPHLGARWNEMSTCRGGGPPRTATFIGFSGIPENLENPKRNHNYFDFIGFIGFSGIPENPKNQRFPFFLLACLIFCNS